jgi:hypothetical protein
MPFMTEELWAHTAGEGKTRENLICHAEWPSPAYADNAAADEINWLIDLVSGIRSVRSEMNVPPSATAPLVMVGANALTKARLETHDSAIRRLARASDVSLEETAPKGAAQIVVGEATACLPLGSPDRSCGRKGPPRKGDRQGKGRGRAHREQAVERKIRGQCEAGGRRGGARTFHRTGTAARKPCRGAFSRE